MGVQDLAAGGAEVSGGPGAHPDEAVRRFLQCAMVVDDRADLGQPPDAPGRLREPVAPAPIDEEIDEEPTAPPDALDAKALVDAFAAMGLVCGVMRPEPPAEPQDLVVVPAASHADIVILDWHLADEGGHALSILAGLAQRPGLRLAAIYTYDERLGEIAETVARHLGGDVLDTFRVRAGSFAVEVYAKEGTALDGDAAARVQAPAQLAGRLVEDFGSLTRGIVPTAAVAAIGALRTETPRVLGLLGDDLDPGFLGHRVLLPDPDDADRHLLDLIGSELRTVIEDDPIVRAAIGIDAIEAHVRQMPEGPLTKDTLVRALQIGTARKASREELRAREDVARESELKIGNPKVSHTRLFVRGHTEDEGRDADVLFGRRMSLRTDTQTLPMLQLGTIIEREDEWLVCVQPDCDAVRLDAPREFPFLPAAKVGLNEKLDLVVRCAGADVALQLEMHLHRVRKVEFAPDAGARAVLAMEVGGERVFLDTAEAPWRYIAQLKRDQSHRLSRRFNEAGGRVGLDESEVFRRWSERSK